MNMQAIMKQAQKMQKDMMKSQNEINNKVFESSNSMVQIKMKGTYEIEEFKIKIDCIDKEDIEMLEDSIKVAINNVIEQIKTETENKMGAYTQGLPGIF